MNILNQIDSNQSMIFTGIFWWELIRRTWCSHIRCFINSRGDIVGVCVCVLARISGSRTKELATLRISDGKFQIIELVRSFSLSFYLGVDITGFHVLGWTMLV